ncbi:hypothetical protein [Streptomyces sp. NPDC002587]
MQFDDPSEATSGDNLDKLSTGIESNGSAARAPVPGTPLRCNVSGVTGIGPSQQTPETPRSRPAFRLNGIS